MLSALIPALRPPPVVPSRRGFTLVELVAALVLLSVGALALVAASAAAIRSISAAESQIAATSAARNRVELLASADCAKLRDSAGVDSSGPVRERWSIGSARNGARLVTDSLEYTDRTGSHAIALRRLVIC